MITIFTRGVCTCPSVRYHSEKTNFKWELIATGGTSGLTEGIINDTAHLISYFLIFTGKQKRKGFLEGLDEIENNPNIQTAEQLMQLEAEAGLASEDASGPAGDQNVEPDQLVINEPVTPMAATPTPGKKKTPGTTGGRQRGGNKRKADSAAGTPIPAKMARGAATPSTPETPASAEPERTSRSGRIIKPKKFDDEKMTPKVLN